MMISALKSTKSYLCYAHASMLATVAQQQNLPIHLLKYLEVLE